MFAHVPLTPPVLAAVQALHVPVQVVLQQTPSTQLPLRQSLLAMQVWPLSSLQTPEPLQEPLAHSLAGSCPFAMLEQVPTEPATLHA